MKKGTKKIEATSDLQGFDDLKSEDQKLVKKYITGIFDCILALFPQKSDYFLVGQIAVQPPPKAAKGAKLYAAATVTSPGPSPPPSPASMTT